jgi:hypothetical protein
MARFRSALPSLAPPVSGRASYYHYYISYGHITGGSETGMTTNIQTRKDRRRRPGGEEPRGIFRRLERCCVGFLGVAAYEETNIRAV